MHNILALVEQHAPQDCCARPGGVIRVHSIIAEVTLVAWLRKVSCPNVREVSVHIFTSVTGLQVKKSLEVDTCRPHLSASFSSPPA